MGFDEITHSLYSNKLVFVNASHLCQELNLQAKNGQKGFYAIVNNF